MNENQLSRYGAIAKAYEINPQAKVFFVAPSTATWKENFLNVFPPDADGVVRVHTTIAAALLNCVANRGDLILVLPGYTETRTTALTLNVAGVKILGLGEGTLRPTITGNGTIDCVNITAANVTLEHFHFPAPDTDNQTSVINIAGVAGVTIKDITGIGSQTAKNVVDMITIVAGSNDLLIENVRFYNTTVAVNSFISFEGACSRITVRDFYAYGEVATAGLIDGATITHLILERVNIATTGTTIPAALLNNNPIGLALSCRWAGTSTTLANNCDLGNAMRLFDNLVLEETNNSAQGALIPPVDVD